MKIILLLLVLSVITLTACDTKQKSAQAPVTAFKKLYPGAVVTRWGDENPLWKASFTQNGQKGSVLFDAHDQVVETVLFYQENALPNQRPITEYIKANYPGKRIQTCEKVTQANGRVRYGIQIKGKKLVFDNVGNFITEEQD